MGITMQADVRGCHRAPSLIINTGHTFLDCISGADARRLTEAIEKHVDSPESTTPLSRPDESPTAPSAVEKVETPEELEVRLRELMNQSNVVSLISMKGSPDLRCGFSRKICDLLRDNKIEFLIVKTNLQCATG
jgi:hypothetical protein